MRRQSGFTLVELVIVIVISSVLSLVVMQFITTPIEAYVDQSRRARLVDIALTATGRMLRDVQQALPNSIRVACGGDCVEFLRAQSGGRYRAAPPGDVLSFVPTDADTAFDVLGPLNNFSALATSTAATACVSGTAACVVIYNTGTSGTDAWNSDNIATLASVSATSVGFVNSNFSSGDTAFPAASPDQRFYLVDSPISFLCDTGAGTLRRYEGYNVTAAQTSVDTHAELTGLGNPAEHALLADQISDCDFSYSPGTPSRNGVLTASITVAEAGEQVTLLQQMHVPNLP